MKIGDLSIQRFRIPKGLTPRMFVLDPHPEGEWVSYSDHCAVLEGLLHMVNKEIPPIKRGVLQCGAKIEIEGTKGIAVTYCFKPLGHEGKHE